MEAAAEPDPISKEDYLTSVRYTQIPNWKVWERVDTNAGPRYRCRICNDMHLRELRRTVAHERSNDHQDTLNYHTQTARFDSPEPPSELPLAAFMLDGVQTLLDSLAAPAGYPSGGPQLSDYTEPISPPRNRLIDWGLSENSELEPSLEAQAVAQIARQLSEYFNTDPASEDEQEERSEDDNDGDDDQEPTVTGTSNLLENINTKILI